MRMAGTAPDEWFCPIREVPFRSVNCSDAAGSEVPYHSIQELLDGASGSSTTGPMWDDDSESPGSTSATFAQSGAIHQYVRPPSTSTSASTPMPQEAAARSSVPAQLSSADTSTTTRAA